MATKEKSSLVEYETSALNIVEQIIRQWLMPLRGLDRGSHEDKWLNEAIVKFLKIINIDYVRKTEERGMWIVHLITILVFYRLNPNGGMEIGLQWLPFKRWCFTTVGRTQNH